MKTNHYPTLSGYSEFSNKIFLHFYSLLLIFSLSLKQPTFSDLPAFLYLHEILSIGFWSIREKKNYRKLHTGKVICFIKICLAN